MAHSAEDRRAIAAAASRPVQRRATALLFLAAVLWGTGFVGVPFAMNAGLLPLEVLAIRFALASAILGVWVCAKRRSLARRGGQPSSLAALAKASAAAGGLFFAAFLAQTEGIRRTTPSNNAFLTATYVLMVPLIAWAIEKKRSRRPYVIASVVSLVATAILSVRPGETNLLLNSGDLLTLLGALLFAAHIVYLSHATRFTDAIELTFGQMVTAAVLASACLLGTRASPRPPVNWTIALPAVLYLGVVCTCVAFALQTVGQRDAPPGKAGVILSSEAVFGCLFSILFGLEPFTLRLLIGGPLLLGAIYFLEYYAESAEAPPSHRGET